MLRTDGVHTRVGGSNTMAMITGGGQRAVINVTPMIDVLLVLLIVFMVVIRAESEGLDARVPQPSNEDETRVEDIVLLVRDDMTVTLNREVIESHNLESRLAEVHKTRGNPVIFVGASADLPFEPVLHVIDVARGAGLTRIALLPKGSL